MATLTAELMEQREQSDACIDSTESRQKKAEGQQIEQNKQLLIEKTRDMRAIYDELVAAGAIELSDEQLNEINGGHWWEKLAELEKRTNKDTSDTGNLSLY